MMLGKNGSTVAQIRPPAFSSCKALSPNAFRLSSKGRVIRQRFSRSNVAYWGLMAAGTPFRYRASTRSFRIALSTLAVYLIFLPVLT
jgi:hypothetical protein